MGIVDINTLFLGIKIHISLRTTLMSKQNILKWMLSVCWILLSTIFTWSSQTAGIPMATNCAPLLADLFLYAYRVAFIQGVLKAGTKRLAQQFNFTYRYIDDVLSLNNSKISEFITISWIIFILDLGPSYTDKLLEFRWVQIAHLS